ncbi:MAG: FG-GAP-like repeat-containing protein [Sandaracinaceae bacterium]
MRRVFLLGCSVLVLYATGCDCAGEDPELCTSDGECPGERCVDGMCVPAPDAGTPMDAAPPIDAGRDAGQIEVCDSGVTCEGECCGENRRCAYGACTIDFGPCETNDDCAGDSYCDADLRCTPYGTPPDVTRDEDCARPITVGDFTPDEQCRWEGPPSGDAFEDWRAVYSAPMVADFNLDDDDAVLAPSIVISTFAAASTGGILRLLDGRTCEEQLALTDVADRLIYASNQAIGDLDGAPDGRPEIVGTALAAPSSAGGLVAFKYNPDEATFERLWYGRRCDLEGAPRHSPNGWANNNGPSLYDLDDDGVPEVLLDGFVYDNEGCLLNPGGTYQNYLGLGLFAVVVDVDADGRPELVRPNGVFEWVDNDWVLESSWAPPVEDAVEAVRIGHVAVADMGEFPGAVGDAPGNAEIIVASAPAVDSDRFQTGTVRVMTLAGDIVFGPYPLPAEGSEVSGRGGPPTVADFDGDGRREFAVAGGSRYTVFDLDCDIDSGTASGCARTETTRGVLWSRPSQDFSSNVTGSSIFDFDGDGQAEVVYGDECFVRIYRGTDGEVLFSVSASSGTGYELPVIADVDGDFNSEIVFALTNGLPCPATDPIFTRGTSTFEPGGSGIRVLRDVMDRWAASRPIWNQHAYSVTHVNDDGTIPRTSAWVANHTDSTLNNFRQNAQGSLELRGAADLTVSLARAADLCDSLTGEVTLAANVCNRGTNPVPDGARVVFYAGDPDGGADIACETTLPRLLDPATCTEVTCDWTVPDGEDVARSVTVVVDPDGEVFECRGGNNRGVVPDIFCGGLL